MRHAVASRRTATVTDTLGILTFEDHSKFTGTPTIADNLWHMNPDNYAYRQEIHGAFVSTDELVVEKDGVLVYSGPNHINVEGPIAVVDSTDKATLTLTSPDRVIVSAVDPPDAADVATEDLTKFYAHVNADGVVKSISYIQEVDPHTFSLTSEEYTTGEQQYRGFRATGNYGYLVPPRNLVVMEHQTDGVGLMDIKFEDGNTDPFDYADYSAGLTVYRRLKTSTGDWGHHNLARDAGDHFNFQGTVGIAFFGSNQRYDVILRVGQFGDGTSATVPAANRLVPYPGGLKREYLPTADNIDNITQVYDIIREMTTSAATAATTTVDAAWLRRWEPGDYGHQRSVGGASPEMTWSLGAGSGTLFATATYSAGWITLTADGLTHPAPAGTTVLFDVPIGAVAGTGDVFIEVNGAGVGINLLDNIGDQRTVLIPGDRFLRC